MVRYLLIQNKLAVLKTEHYATFTEDEITNAVNAGEAKKWRSGKEMSALWLSLIHI